MTIYSFDYSFPGLFPMQIGDGTNLHLIGYAQDQRFLLRSSTSPFSAFFLLFLHLCDFAILDSFPPPYLTTWQKDEWGMGGMGW